MNRAEEDLADRFERLRPHLLRVAYSQLGELGEAEDVVQEAWLRLGRVDAPSIGDLRAWLTTTVARLALDALGSARARRERYVGQWLPEPLLAPDTSGPSQDPADRVTLDESVSFALLVVLERLSPAERTAFVLADVFGLPFEEIAAIVGRSPAACRQLASRARAHVTENRPRFPADEQRHGQVVRAFAAAVAGGDMADLLRVLAPTAVMRSDGGGRVNAARRPLQGAERVARAVLALARTMGPADVREVSVNGLLGLLVDAGAERTVCAFTVDAGQIVAVDLVRNPDKLRLTAP